MPSVSGWALQVLPRSPTATARSSRFYALGVGLGFARRCTPSGTCCGAITVFLCPRCRAGLCKRCPPEGLLTCAFAACCAKLPENRAETALIGAPPFRQAPDQPLSPRRPSRKTLCTRASVPALKMLVSLAAVMPGPSVRSRRSRASSGRRFRRIRRTAPGSPGFAVPPRARSLPA
jgi:hypothetical protein